MPYNGKGSQKRSVKIKITACRGSGVFDTFDAVVTSTSNAYSLFDNDRGAQYTSRTFHLTLKNTPE